MKVLFKSLICIIVFLSAGILNIRYQLVEQGLIRMRDPNLQSCKSDNGIKLGNSHIFAICKAVNFGQAYYKLYLYDSTDQILLPYNRRSRIWNEEILDSANKRNLKQQYLFDAMLIDWCAPRKIWTHFFVLDCNQKFSSRLR